MELNKLKKNGLPKDQTLNTLAWALTQSFPKCVQKTVYHTYTEDLLCIKHCAKPWGHSNEYHKCDLLHPYIGREK